MRIGRETTGKSGIVRGSTGNFRNPIYKKGYQPQQPPRAADLPWGLCGWCGVVPSQLPSGWGTLRPPSAGLGGAAGCRPASPPSPLPKAGKHAFWPSPPLLSGIPAPYQPRPPHSPSRHQTAREFLLVGVSGTGCKLADGRISIFQECPRHPHRYKKTFGRFWPHAWHLSSCTAKFCGERPVVNALGSYSGSWIPGSYTSSVAAHTQAP